MEIMVEEVWRRSTPDKREIFADADGSIEISVGASIFFIDRRAVKAEVAGSTAIEAAAKPEEGGDKPVLDVKIEWGGIKAIITIEFAWGIVEYKREFKLWDGCEIYSFQHELVP